MAEYKIIAKTPKQPRPRINACGDCGVAVPQHALLCDECRIQDVRFANLELELVRG